MLRITDSNIRRMEKAVTNDFRLEVKDKPLVEVTDLTSDSNTSHTVNAESYLCSCEDSEYNLKDGEYCKHAWYVAFKRARIL